MRLFAIPLLLLSLWGSAVQAAIPDKAISFVPTTGIPDPAPDPPTTPQTLPPFRRQAALQLMGLPKRYQLQRPPSSPAISFDPPVIAPVVETVAVKPAAPPPPDAPTVVQQKDIFAGGSDSLVARTVGHAEGTRTADGHKTRAYYGHSDPGNGVWNLGSFSYQHSANSPEDADEKQLRRLQSQADTIRQKADAHRLELSLEEELNAIDLANQSPWPRWIPLVMSSGSSKPATADSRDRMLSSGHAHSPTGTPDDNAGKPRD